MIQQSTRRGDHYVRTLPQGLELLAHVGAPENTNDPQAGHTAAVASEGLSYLQGQLPCRAEHQALGSAQFDIQAGQYR